jgi:hypothetical protein
LADFITRERGQVVRAMGSWWWAVKGNSMDKRYKNDLDDLINLEFGAKQN